MHITQHLIYKNSDIPTERDPNAHLVLCFGAKSLIGDHLIIESIRQAYPNAQTVYCTTAGEILGANIFDNTIALTAITFKNTKVKSNSINISRYKNSFNAGIKLASKFDQKGLNYLLLISDGSHVNGTELLKGLNLVFKNKIPITGGLAGDATNFENTLVGINKMPVQDNIVAVGFYGDKLRMSHASMSGWDPFGIERTITKSEGNILYEIDNKNALELYKSYLGKYAKDLPASAVHFPLSIQNGDQDGSLVRTIIGVDQKQKTMSFAGEVPIGRKVRFMKANFDKLIDSAGTAAQNTLSFIKDMQPEFAILISCIGRKIILRERTIEEIEAVDEVLGKNVKFTGFYSYGEISPLIPGGPCELHNQSMTITCFQELE